MITKSQRAIAYLLLICQLLTSCGGKNTLLPRDPNAQVMTTVHEQQTICSEDKELDGYTKPTSFIDATPLKLGQTEIKFTWDSEKGLQAFVIDPSMGPVASYVSVKLPATIKLGNGSQPIVLHQLNQQQAEFIVKGLKWKANKAGDLKEMGVRLRGGMGKKGKDTGKGEVSGKGDGKGGASGKGESKGRTSGKGDGKKGKDSGKGRVPNKGAGKKRGDHDKVAKQEQESQVDSRSASSQGKGSIHEVATPGMPSGSNGEKDANSNKNGVKTPGSVSESSVSEVSSRDTRHTDCSDDSQQEIYHNIVNGVVKDFFRDHFKTSPYLPNPTLQKASETDTSTDSSTPTMLKASDTDTSTDSSTHTYLAKIHNHKKGEIDSHVKTRKFLQKHLVDQKTGQLRGLNVVIASITFFDKYNNEIIKTYIKSDSDFLSPYKDKSITDKLFRKNRHEELIDEFNKSLASFLTKHPGILNPKVKVKRDDGKDAGEEEIDNPLLSERKYNTTNLVYDEIKKNIIKALDAAAKDTKKYEGFKRIEDKSEEERIILKSIVSARRHSEEALSEYMRSNEFYNQLDELLKEKIKKLGKKQADNQSATACLAINGIRIDVHSTKESCLPCQITLRCVRHALEEKFFGKELADAMEASYEEETKREIAEKQKVRLYISSQKGYDHNRKNTTSTTPKAKDQDEFKDEYDFPIQYPYSEDLSKIKLSDDDKKGMKGKLTAFIDGIWEHKHELDDSLNGSAAQKEVVRLQTILEEETARADKAEEAAEKAREEAAEKLAEKDELIKQLMAKLAAVQQATASSSAGNPVQS